MNNVSSIVGISVASMIGCYLVFPSSLTKKVYKKVSGKELVVPENFMGRVNVVSKKVTDPEQEVQFYRNIGLFGTAVYLIATQGHQFTVMG